MSWADAGERSGMSIAVIIALIGLVVLFAGMIGIAIKDIHDQMYDDAREDRYR